MREAGDLLGQKGHAEAIGDELNHGRLAVGLLQNPTGESGGPAGLGQPFPRAGMGFCGHADKELRGEVGEPDLGLLRERMIGREDGEYRVSQRESLK